MKSQAVAAAIAGASTAHSILWTAATSRVSLLFLEQAETRRHDPTDPGRVGGVWFHDVPATTAQAIYLAFSAHERVEPNVAVSSRPTTAGVEWHRGGSRPPVVRQAIAPVPVSPTVYRSRRSTNPRSGGTSGMALEMKQNYTRVLDYLGSSLPDEAVFDWILKETVARGIPEISVTPVQGRILNLLTKLVGARRVVEIGSLSGYSGSWIATALPPAPEGKLTSLEISEKHAEMARDSFRRAGVADRAEVIVGPALASLEKLEIDGDRKSVCRERV